jgi:hypothetical protein
MVAGECMEAGRGDRNVGSERHFGDARWKRLSRRGMGYPQAAQDRARRASSAERQTIETGVQPDNLRWDDAGRVLLTGQRVANIEDYVACALSDARVCADPFVVLRRTREPRGRDGGERARVEGIRIGNHRIGPGFRILDRHVARRAHSSGGQAGAAIKRAMSAKGLFGCSRCFGEPCILACDQGPFESKAVGVEHEGHAQCPREAFGSI